MKLILRVAFCYFCLIKKLTLSSNQYCMFFLQMMWNTFVDHIYTEINHPKLKCYLSKMSITKFRIDNLIGRINAAEITLFKSISFWACNFQKINVCLTEIFVRIEFIISEKNCQNIILIFEEHRQIVSTYIINKKFAIFRKRHLILFHPYVPYHGVPY